MNCVKDRDGKIVIESDEIKEVWRKYMEKLLNEENGIRIQPVTR